MNRTVLLLNIARKLAIKVPYISIFWGYSAVGSAFAWHAKGHEFESR